LVEKAYEAHSSINKTFGDLSGASTIRKNKSVAEAAQKDIKDTLDAMQCMVTTLAQLEGVVERLEKRPREKLVSEEVCGLLNEFLPQIIESAVGDLSTSAMRRQIGDANEGIGAAALDELLTVLVQRYPQLDIQSRMATQRQRMLVVRIPAVITMAINMKLVESDTSSDGGDSGGGLSELEICSVFVLADDEPGPTSKFQVFRRITYDAKIFWYTISGFSIEHRISRMVQWFSQFEDLFSATCSGCRRHLQIDPRTSQHLPPLWRDASRGIRVVDDDFGLQAGAAGRGAAPRSRGTAAMKRLNAQFIDLDVQEQSKRKGRARQNRRGRGRPKGKSTPQEAAGPPPPPQDDMSDGAFGEMADDYIANLSDAGRMQLTGEGARPAFAIRDIGGGADYRCSPTAGTIAGPGSISSDDYAVDDPFRLGDEAAELEYGVSSDDDDGFPCDMDLQRLPGPDGPPASRSGQKGYMQRAQNAETSKGRDRAKSRRGRQKQSSDAPGHGHGDGPSSGFDPYKILKRLDLLTQTSDLESIWLQPMNRQERQVVHILAREYKVKSKSHGNGVMRAPVLTATPDSYQPQNRRRINRVLHLYEAGGLLPEYGLGGPSSDKHANRGKGGGKGGRSKQGPAAAPAGSLHGKMVAEGAPEVGASNIGHKMLQQMGWTPGTGLGAEEKGRATPVDVTIRAGRRGLGA
ncbi:squalene synthetase-like protein, partial [Coemansia biformis]